MHISDASVFEQKLQNLTLWDKTDFETSFSLLASDKVHLAPWWKQTLLIFNNHKPCVCIQFHQAYQKLDLQ